FVPDEDQGYFIIAIQAPSGASLEYTKAIGKQVSGMLAGVEEAQGTFSVAGFSFAGAAANQGLIFVPLKPYSQRKGEVHSATAIVNRVRPMLFGVQGAIVFATLPRRFRGWDSLADSSSWCRIWRRTNSKNWRARRRASCCTLGSIRNSPDCIHRLRRMIRSIW